MPAMQNHAKVWGLFGLLLCSSLIACKKNEAPVSPAAPPKVAAAAPASPATDTSAQALLTEDKLSRFLIYQKEMLAVALDSMNVGLQAFAKAGTDQKKLQGEMAGDKRSAHIAEVSKAALEKSGLTQSEIPALTQLTSPYYAKAYALQGAVKKLAEIRKNIEEAKAKGKTPDMMDTTMEPVYAKQADGLESMRTEFKTKHGADALALFQKHEPDFFAINEKMMAAAMGAMKK
jgi:hypothetical protein